MKDARRLKDKIGKLSSEKQSHGPEGRDIVQDGDGDGLVAVLREIDETILPRALTFTSDMGSVVLAAGNRRLIAVLGVEGDGLATASALEDMSLTQPDVVALGRLRDGLTTVFGDAAFIRVTSAPAKAASDGFADGTLAISLASAWGIDLSGGEETPGADADPLGTFYASLPNHARAWLQMEDGKPIADGGDPEVLARLKDFADSADMADLDMQVDPDQNRFTAIGRAPNDGDCLLFVSNTTNATILMLPADKLETTKASWRKAQ